MTPETEAPGIIDTLLAPYLETPDEDTAEHLLADLLTQQAEPVAASVIRKKLRASLRAEDGSLENQNALEVKNDVHLHLLAELQSLRAQTAGKVIANFRSYVAVVSYHACYEHLRRKYPRRHSLKNKLRYLLTHQPDFALWEAEPRELKAGLAVWRNQTNPERNEELWAALCEEPTEWAALTWPGRPPNTVKPLELLRGLFAAVAGPVDLDDLVGVCAAVWEVRDVQEESHDEATAEYGDRLADQTANVAVKLEQTQYLQRLWDEVGQLPVRQRTALLLNLRDVHGRGVIALLPLTGVASLRQIAESLEMPALEMAEIWTLLPLDDAAIAGRLNITRQQVINLRKAARERLMRRMRQFA